MAEATDVDLHHDPMLIKKKNIKKKREIESSDEDSRWQFFSLVVIVYTKIRQAYSLFVFHAGVTPCRHTHTHASYIGECLPFYIFENKLNSIENFLSHIISHE